MGGFDVKQFGSTTVSALQASVSVILILGYGYMLRRKNVIDSKTEKGISTLCVNIFLPCLLFTQIGPLATPSNLQSYWIIVVLSLLYQVISWVFGVIGVKLFGFSEWLIPCMIFNNATSLPLLLLQSLGKIGTLKNLVQDGDSMDEVLRRGKVYLLINALVANLVRFAVGPYMLNQAEEKSDQHQEPRQESTDRPSLRRYDSVSAASYQQGEDEDGEANETTGLLERLGERTTSSKPWKKTRDISAKVLGFTNPPVWAGLLAILVGVIPFLRHALFDDTGALSAFEQSIDNLGQLYTALQTLILGSQLKSKAGSRPPTGTLAYLFLYRFFVVTAISCGLVYGSRKVLGEYMKKDPVLDFMLILAPIGPPALSLAAIVSMSSASEEVTSKVAQTLLLSHVATPLISLSVSAGMAVVEGLYGK